MSVEFFFTLLFGLAGLIGAIVGVTWQLGKIKGEIERGTNNVRDQLVDRLDEIESKSDRQIGDLEKRLEGRIYNAFNRLGKIDRHNQSQSKKISQLGHYVLHIQEFLIDMGYRVRLNRELFDGTIPPDDGEETKM